MKRSVRVLALLLALCMAFGLSACGAGSKPADAEEAPAPAEAPPDAAPETPPEPELPDPAALYEAGLEKLRPAPDLDMQIARSLSLTIGAYSLEEKYTRDMKCRGLGGPDPSFWVLDRVEPGTGKADLTLCFRGGMAYADLKQAKYCSEMTAEEFLAMQIPLEMLDPELYPETAAEADEKGTHLTFRGAEAAEAWAVPEGAVISEASGEVRLTDDGEISSCTYETAYSFGGAEIHRRYEVTYVTTPSSADFPTPIPESAEDHVPLDSLEAPILLLRSAGLLGTIPVLTAEKQQYVMSAAAGCVCAEQRELSWYDDGAYIERDSASTQFVDLAGGSTESYSYEYSFSDGTMTWSDSEGGSDSYRYSTAELKDLDQFEILQYLPAWSDLSAASVTDLGEFLMIEYKGAEFFGLTLEDAAEYALYSEVDRLDGLASACETQVQEGYLVVEKDTCLPVSLGASYAGTHTLEGAPYAMTLTAAVSLRLMHPDTYMAITGELLPDEAPTEDPTPLFYEVSGDGGAKMYLLGTIHVGDGRTDRLPQVVLDALEASDALAVEFDVDAFNESAMEDEDLQSVLAECFFYADGSTISAHIDPDLYARAVPLMKAAGQYSATAESMKPYLWALALQQFCLSSERRLSSDRGVDTRLMALAREQNKPILDVESGESQLRMMAEFSDDVQQMLLREAVGVSRTQTARETWELYEMWCEGDEQALTALLSSSAEADLAELDEADRKIYAEYDREMLGDRNAAMLEVADGYLKGGTTVFYAVGLAHLLGEQGLIAALRGAGYTVTPVNTRG